jgi:hypothetical protein
MRRSLTLGTVNSRTAETACAESSLHRLSCSAWAVALGCRPAIEQRLAAGLRQPALLLMEIRHNTIDLQSFSTRQRIVHDFCALRINNCQVSVLPHRSCGMLLTQAATGKTTTTVRRNPMEAPKS